MTRPICRHCNRKPVTRPRGLCWYCYYDLNVRDLYPVHRILAQSEVQKAARVGPLAAFDWRNESPPPAPSAPPELVPEPGLLIARAEYDRAGDYEARRHKDRTRRHSLRTRQKTVTLRRKARKECA